MSSDEAFQTLFTKVTERKQFGNWDAKVYGLFETAAESCDGVTGT